MVKTFLAACLLLMIAVPVLAQDDFPRVEVGFGYSNIGFPDATGVTQRHSGFAQETGLNITRWLGVENYFGYYSMGASNATLLTNMVGGKLMWRTDRAVPYVVAGFGGGSVSQVYGNQIYGQSAMSSRLGAGFDIPLSEMMNVKFDLSKFQMHTNGWQGGTNFTVGIVLKMGF